MSQLKHLAVRIFGVYDPYNPDNLLNKIESKYREHTLKVIHEMMMMIFERANTHRVKSTM